MSILLISTTIAPMDSVMAKIIFFGGCVYKIFLAHNVFQYFRSF